jgi:hypothetical protein
MIYRLFDMAPAAEESERQNAAQLLFLSCFCSEKEVERRFLVSQCHTPPQELLLHLLVYHCI